MKKVHITLVGGQPAAVYNGIVATAPDFVVFIYSASSKSLLARVKNEISIPSRSVELDPTDPSKILAEVKSLAKSYANDEVTVNISSGLKSWSYFFGLVFAGEPNATVVYIDQNNILWNYKDMTCKPGLDIDMKTNFRLYGNSIEDCYRMFSDYTEEDRACIEQIERAKQFQPRQFNYLTALLDKPHQDYLNSHDMGSFQESSGAFVEWERDRKNAIEHVKLVLVKGKTSLETVLESKHAVEILFNTHWFELKIASLLSRWDKAKEIIMNCKFQYKPNVDKNETDIIVNAGTKLLFVECKTQIAHTNDIDKFRSVVKGYGGMGSKGLFITEAPMKDVARLKCEENGIIPFSLQDTHLLDTDKSLFLTLDAELFNINTK